MYLDNAATSWPKPAEVGRAMSEFLASSAGNPGRGGHALARAAAEPIESVRESLGSMLKSPCPNRVVMTGGCTDSVNLALHGVLRGTLRSCGEMKPSVITTVAEHNAVLRTLHCYQTQGEIDLRIVPTDGRGLVDPKELISHVTDCTVLVCVTHASNAMGTIQPVAEIGRRLRAANPRALFFVDAAQTVGHMPVDVEAEAIDLLAIAGHKGLLGPTATGALYVGPRAFEDGEEGRLFCQRRGGTGARAEGLEMPNVLPDALEAGTSNAVGFAGLAAALESAPAARHVVEARHTGRIMQALSALEGVTIYGPTSGDPRTPVVLFNIAGRDAREVGCEMDSRFDVCVRGGTHCAPLLHQHIGTGQERDRAAEAGGVRVSPGCYTSDDDVDRFLAAAKSLAEEAVLAGR